MTRPKKDSVDAIQRQWIREFPELDTQVLAIPGRILALKANLEHRMDQRLRDLGLPLFGFDVLFALRRVGPPFTLTPKQLMKACLLTSGAMSHRLLYLEELTYLERSPCTMDSRSVRVALTPKGKELVERAMPVRLNYGLKILTPLTGREVNQLQTLLRKLLTHLEPSH